MSDTHDALTPTEQAIQVLSDLGAQALFHCGDIVDEPIVKICSQLPLHFVFGNHDSDMTRILSNAAQKHGANCMGWGGTIELAGKTIAMAHGHLTSDLKPLLDKKPDYLFSGHFHQKRDWMAGTTRRIVPGALFRAVTLSIATLNLVTDDLEFIDIA